MPKSTHPNVTLSVRIVPTVNGVGFFAASPAASAMGAITGMNRPISITRPVAMSQGTLYGAGVGLSLAPYVSPNPSKPEPLLAAAEVNS